MTDDAERLRLADALKRAFADATAVGAPALAHQEARDRQGFQAVATLSEETRADSPCHAAKPISFTLPLLRAVIEGRKTVTRRPIRPQPASVRDGVAFAMDGARVAPPCTAGDRLWIREKWGRAVGEAGRERFVYALDAPTVHVRWQASRFMPRAAARFTLEVTGVLLARLGAVDDADALRESIDPGVAEMLGPRAAFLALWDSIYGGTEFGAVRDPWVWVIDFKLECAS